MELHAVHRRFCGLGILVVGLLAPNVQAELRPVDPAQFFVTARKDTKLVCRMDPTAPGKSLKYTLTDYLGQEVSTAEAEVGSDGQVVMPVALAPGYYELALAGSDQRLGICALPERVGPADPFFCMDSALSWLELRGDVREAVVRSLKRVGVSVSRERLSWGEVQPDRERWNWQTARQYESGRQVYAKSGVGMLEMFHDAPGWMGARPDRRYPTDLVAVAGAWAEIGRRWRPYWAALEIWNEPDIFFGSNLPGDQYVTVAKAVAYGLRDVKPAVPLVGGVLTDVCPDEYRQSCARNGLLQEVDAISFHTYARADSVERMVGMYREWLKGAGVESMPLWITESGRPWKKGVLRAPADQDAESALDIIMKGIEARACGVAAYYPFISVYYEENDNNFGMMGKDVTPLRAMAAYAQAITALGGRAYRGDLATSDPAIQRARVFGDERRAVVVLYTGQVKRGATLRLDIPFSRLEGIDGRELKAPERGVVPIEDGLTYAWVDAAKLGPELRRDTPAAKLYALSQRVAPRRVAPSPIVLQHRFDTQQVTAATRGYSLSPQAAQKFRLQVRAHNLGDRPRHVALMLARTGEAAPAEGTPVRDLEIPASGSADAVWALDLRPWVDSKGTCALSVHATSADVTRISPLAIDVAIKAEAAATQPQ